MCNIDSQRIAGLKQHNYISRLQNVRRYKCLILNSNENGLQEGPEIQLLLSLESDCEFLAPEQTLLSPIKLSQKHHIDWREISNLAF